MHRILFRIPMPFGLKPLEIAAYGTMVAIGALIAIYIASVRARRHRVNPNIMLDLALAVLISGLLGARLAYFVFDDWSEFAGGSLRHALGLFINFPSGGLSFYGALALGIPTGLVFLKLRLRKEPGTRLWHVVDIAIISIVLGVAFARVGCYLNGCCFGKPCPESFPLAQAFPLHQGKPLSIPAQHYLHEHMMTVYGHTAAGTRPARFHPSSAGPCLSTRPRSSRRSTPWPCSSCSASCTSTAASTASSSASSASGTASAGP